MVEDGALIHTIIVFKRWQCKHLIDNLDHLECSPDLNPIEHIWTKLKEIVSRRPIVPKNLQRLEIVIKEEWKKIDRLFINFLINSMLRHVLAVQKANNGSTKN